MKMKKVMIKVLLFVALLVAVDGARDPGVANAENTQPTDSPYACMNIASNLLPCLKFSSIGSKLSKPAPDCCQGLQLILKENATCLCLVLESAPKYGFDLNYTRALEVPQLCGVTQLPAVARCNITVPPSPSPTVPPHSPPTPVTPRPSPHPPTTPPHSNPPPSTPPPSNPPPSTPPPSNPPPSTLPPPSNPPPSTPPPNTPPPSTTPSTPAPKTPSTPGRTSNSSATAPTPSPQSSPSSSGTSIVPQILVVVSAIMVVAPFLVV